MTERFKKSVDDAIKSEVDRLLRKCMGDFAYCCAMRQIYEARDPFFPREQVEDET